MGRYQLKLGQYTGNGSDNRSITGVGFQPDMVWVFSNAGGAGTAGQQYKTDRMTGDSSDWLYTEIAQFANCIQAFETDGFQVGTDTWANANGVVYNYMAVKKGDDTAKFFQTGNYSGNSTDNRNITGAGFQPTCVVIDPNSATLSRLPTWKINENTTQDTMYFTATADLATNGIQSFISDGFQLGTSNRVNATGTDYYWFAYKADASVIKTGTYTGNGTNNTLINTGFAPHFVMIKRDGAFVTVYKTSNATNTYDMNGATYAGINSFTTNGFRIGTIAQVNNSGSVYRYIAVSQLLQGTQTISTNSFIKQTYTKTINSNAWIRVNVSTSAVSNYYVKKLGTTKTITSDAYIIRNKAIVHGFQRSQLKPATAYWRGEYNFDQGRMEFYYATSTQSSWIENVNARITCDSTTIGVPDLNKWADASADMIPSSIAADIVYKRAGEVKIRRMSAGSGEYGWSWGTEYTVASGADEYFYPSIDHLAGGKIGVIYEKRIGTNYYVEVIISTAAYNHTSWGTPTVVSATMTASDRMMNPTIRGTDTTTAIYVTWAESTTIKGRYFNGTSWDTTETITTNLPTNFQTQFRYNYDYEKSGEDDKKHFIGYPTSSATTELRINPDVSVPSNWGAAITMEPDEAGIYTCIGSTGPNELFFAEATDTIGPVRYIELWKSFAPYTDWGEVNVFAGRVATAMDMADADPMFLTYQEPAGTLVTLFFQSSYTINSDYYIKKLANTYTLTSNSNVKKIYTETLVSDASIKKLDNPHTLTSNSYIKKLANTSLILSDYYIFKTSTKTLTSDAYIKYFGYEGSITSVDYIKKLDNTKTLASDLYIRRLEANQLDSNYYIKTTSTKTLNSNAYVVLNKTVVHGWQRSQLKPATAYWRGEYNYTSSRMEFWYATTNDNPTWTENVNARITCDSTTIGVPDLNKWADGSFDQIPSTISGDVVYKRSGEVKIRRMSAGSGEYDWSWGTEYTVASGADEYFYVSIDHLAGGKTAVIYEVRSGTNYTVEVAISTNAGYDITTWDSPTVISSTMSGSDRMMNPTIRGTGTTGAIYATWAEGTTIKGRYYNGSAWQTTETITSNLPADFQTQFRFNYDYEKSSESNDKHFIAYPTSSGTAVLRINPDVNTAANWGSEIEIEGDEAGYYMCLGSPDDNVLYFAEAGTAVSPTRDIQIRRAYSPYTDWSYTNTYISANPIAMDMSDNQETFLTYQSNAGAIVTQFFQSYHTISSDYYVLKVTDKTLTSNAFIEKTYSATIISNAEIEVTTIRTETILSDYFVFTSYAEIIFSDYHVKKIDNEATLTSDAMIKPTYSKSLIMDYYIKKLDNTKTLTSDAYVKKLANENTISSDAYILYNYSATLNSNSFITDSYAVIIDQDAFIKILDNFYTITSDAYLKTTYQATIDSNAEIKTTYSKAITSDYHIKFSGYEGSITSISYIKKLGNDKTLTSDAWLMEQHAYSLTSDAFIKATYTKTIVSDAYLKQSYSKTILSDAYLKTTYNKNINSDAFLTASSDKFIFSDGWILKETSHTIDSNARILQAYSKTRVSDSFIKHLGYEATLTSDANIKVTGYEGSITSDYYIKVIDNVATITEDAWINKPQIVTIASDYYIKTSYAELLIQDAFIRFLHTETIVSDYWILKVANKTLNTDSYIKYEGKIKLIVSRAWIFIPFQNPIVSEYYIKATSTKTINSNSFVKKPANTNTILCDADIKGVPVKTLNSNYSVKATSSKTRTSDSYVKKLANTKTIVSDAYISIGGVIGSITSNAYVKTTSTKSITQEGYIKGAPVNSLTSNSDILKITIPGAEYSTGSVPIGENTTSVIITTTPLVTGRLRNISIRLRSLSVGVDSILRWKATIGGVDYYTSTVNIGQTPAIAQNFTFTFADRPVIQSGQTFTIVEDIIQGVSPAKVIVASDASGWNTHLDDVPLMTFGIDSDLVSDYYVKTTYDKTLTQDAYVKILDNEATILCDAYIVYTLSGSLISDYFVKTTYTQYITSDAYVNLLSTSSIISDYWILAVVENNINANYYIKSTGEQNILSDAYIVITGYGSLVSDAYIKRQPQQTITSDAYIFESGIGSLISNAWISECGDWSETWSVYTIYRFQVTIVSDYIITGRGTVPCIIDASYVNMPDMYNGEYVNKPVIVDARTGGCWNEPI